MVQPLYDAALNVKEQIYGKTKLLRCVCVCMRPALLNSSKPHTQTGNRIVLFAPVYLANYCVNSCTYCAFRGANKAMERSMLTMDELRCV